MKEISHSVKTWVHHRLDAKTKHSKQPAAKTRKASKNCNCNYNNNYYGDQLCR